MKALLVSDLPPWVPGGLERHVGDLAVGLREHGVSTIVVAGAARSETHHGVFARRTSLARIPGAFQDPDRPFLPPLPDPEFTTSIVRIGRRWRPDVIHAHGWSAASAVVAAAALRCPLIITLHDYGFACPTKTMCNPEGPDCPGPASRSHGRCALGLMSRTKSEGLNASLPLFRRLIRGATLIAVSGSVRQAARVALGRDVSVIPNFVNDDLFSGRAEPSSHPPRVLFVGGANPVKGLRVLEEAMQGVSAELTVAGPAPEVQTSGVRYLGSVERERIPALMDDANVVVVPSIWEEPCPTAVIEAMSRGRAVIASRIGGIPEILDEGAGRLVTPRDPLELRSAIEELTLSAPLRQRLSEQARRRARSKFSASAVIPQIIQAYAVAR